MKGGGDPLQHLPQHRRDKHPAGQDRHLLHVPPQCWTQIDAHFGRSVGHKGIIVSNRASVTEVAWTMDPAGCLRSYMLFSAFLLLFFRSSKLPLPHDLGSQHSEHDERAYTIQVASQLCGLGTGAAIYSSTIFISMFYNKAEITKKCMQKEQFQQLCAYIFYIQFYVVNNLQ